MFLSSFAVKIVHCSGTSMVKPKELLYSSPWRGVKKRHHTKAMNRDRFTLFLFLRYALQLEKPLSEPFFWKTLFKTHKSFLFPSELSCYWTKEILVSCSLCGVRLDPMEQTVEIKSSGLTCCLFSTFKDH